MNDYSLDSIIKDYNYCKNICKDLELNINNTDSKNLDNSINNIDSANATDTEITQIIEKLKILKDNQSYKYTISKINDFLNNDSYTCWDKTFNYLKYLNNEFKYKGTVLYKLLLNVFLVCLIFVLFMIPVIYTFWNNAIPNLGFRLLILFLVFFSFVYIIEILILRYSAF
jgi:hypothetical protein